MKHDIYMSLDEARSELSRRWRDDELKLALREELGGRFLTHYDGGPVATLWRQLVSADNGLAFFYQCAKYLGANPIIQEFPGDRFTHINEEKKGLGRIRANLPDNSCVAFDIMDFHANENRPIRDCRLKTGERLVDFHHSLLSIDGFKLQIFDDTDWFQSWGRAEDYYYPFLLHFVANGVLVESFQDEGTAREAIFFSEIVRPALDRIKNTFGLSPMVVRAYPQNQTEAEDFYWWSHSPKVNAYLVDYAKQHNFPFKRPK